jgi:hypothetical protein
MTSEARAEVIHGSDLRVGDTIKGWWRPGRDTVTKLVPYAGPLDLGPNPQIASFAICKSGMTITHVDGFSADLKKVLRLAARGQDVVVSRETAQQLKTVIAGMGTKGADRLYNRLVVVSNPKGRDSTDMYLVTLLKRLKPSPGVRNIYFWKSSSNRPSHWVQRKVGGDYTAAVADLKNQYKHVLTDKETRNRFPLFPPKGEERESLCQDDGLLEMTLSDTIGRLNQAG